MAPVQTPSSQLSGETLYQFLLAEIANQRGQREVAAAAYADLARETGDPAIAQRAVEVALLSRDPQLAAQATNLWLELEPDSTTARQTLIALLLTTGRINEAEPHIKRLFAKEPETVGRVFLQLGGLTARYADKQAVLKLMTDLAADYPNLAEARFATAQAASAAQQPAMALDQSKAALNLRPGWEPAALLHGGLLTQSVPREAIQFYRRFIEQHPAAREVRTQLARQLASEKDFAGARKEFEALATAAPNTAEYHFALGILSVEMKDYAAAEKHLNRTLQLNFRDPDLVRTYLGQLNEEQKRYPEAIAWYRQVTGGESYFPARVRVAALMAKQGDLAGGREYLRKIRVSTAEQQAQTVIAEAQILREARQLPAAMEVLSEGLKAQPDSPEILYDRAMTAEKLDKLDLLEADLRKVIALKPDHAHAYNALGYTLAERNTRLAEALDLIEKAYQLAPDDAAILDSLGWVHYRLGNLDQGLIYLRQALALRPDPEVAAHLVEVLLAHGERREAVRVSEKALRDNPDNEALLAVLKKLERQ
ncbi:MAG: tetratricopeptide repeat protein [Burkholderiales bacterium]|nr:tetratricopeptide repeat protein [Burkholderiales bacterium]